MDLENECEAKNNSYLSTIEVVNSLLDSLCSSLSDLGIIVYKGNPALHAEAFQSLAASDGSIYVAVPNYSGKTNADEYISICNETGVRLLGVLTMER